MDSAALRWPDRLTAGLYAEQQFARVAGAFQQVTDALAASRVDWLARETDQERRGAAYELAREMHKLESPVVQFLVELCRPRHLATSPVLRGFYFTGVRARYVQDVAAVPAPRAAGGAQGATAVFSGDLAAVTAPAAPTGRMDKAKAVATAHPAQTHHFYAAGHEFNCDQRGSYDAASAKLARQRTLEFLGKHVG